MENRWLNSVVVLFWMATMTWLVVAKVLPPLRRGEPPNYRSMYTESPREIPPVAWEMSLEGKPLGWAVSQLIHIQTGVTEVRGRIHFERIPWEELSPAWMRFLIRSADSIKDLQMDVDNRMQIDSLGHMTEFRSTLRVPGVRDAITIRGEVNATRLTITVEGDPLYKMSTYLPADALVSDELSPQTRLIGLRVDQEWTVPVFSPLRPSNDPIEILNAKVENRAPMVWGDETVSTYHVVYRSDSGSALSSTREPRASLWVDENGNVLKQESTVLGSKLVFSRLPDARAIELQQKVQEEEGARRRRGRWRDRMPPTEAATGPTTGAAAETDAKQAETGAKQ